MKKFSLTKSVNGSFGLSDNLKINGDIITNDGSLANNLTTINTGITNITQKQVVDTSGNTITLSPLYDQNTELNALFTFNQCPNIPNESLPTSKIILDNVETPLNTSLNQIPINTQNILTLSNQVDTVNSNINLIESRLTTDEANIELNTTNYNNLLTTLQIDETTITTISNNLNNLQTSLTSLNDNLINLENLTIVSIDNNISANTNTVCK
jgi:RNase H-fold protein (predicted Holliday junction resolvase)